MEAPRPRCAPRGITLRTGLVQLLLRWLEVLSPSLDETGLGFPAIVVGFCLYDRFINFFVEALDETGLGFPRVVVGFRRVGATPRRPACSARLLTQASHQSLQKPSSVFVHSFSPAARVSSVYVPESSPIP
jgi:hypothetical protein